MTGPISAPAAKGEPTERPCALRQPVEQRGAMDASTIRREVAEHIWPALKKTPPAMQSTARSISASAKTTIGDFPPSSSDTGRQRAAATPMTLAPTRFEPVNQSLRRCRSRVSAAPASAAPVMKFSTPAGELGLLRDVAVGKLDEARELRGLQHHRATGREGGGELPGAGDEREVHGTIMPTGPTGSKRVLPAKAASGIATGAPCRASRPSARLA